MNYSKFVKLKAVHIWALFSLRRMK